MKVGTVALLGRPNAGKSTLVNNLVGQKVAITSPKPQTTQFPIYAVFDDPSTASGPGRGQIIFVDTPGLFAKTRNLESKNVNTKALHVLKEEIDVLLYIVDHTRKRGVEENKVLGILRTLSLPKILVINKIDIREPSYMEEYRFLEDEFDSVVKVSAIKPFNMSGLLDEIFKYLKVGDKYVIREDLPFPSLNMDANLYMQELIREKAFLKLRKELPYKVHVVVDEIAKRSNGTVYVKARILTPSRYKKMVIGAGGSMIKTISMMSRREIEISSGKKAFVELTVEEE